MAASLWPVVVIPIVFGFIVIMIVGVRMSNRQTQAAEQAFPKRDGKPHDELLIRYPGVSPFEHWVVAELRGLREEHRNWMTRLHVDIHEQLNRMEQTMASNTRLLISAIAAAESKLDGYAVIISANSQAIRDAQAALNALKDEPSTEEVQQVINDLGTHLSTVDTAVANLTSSPVPAAPVDGTVPTPNTDPLPAA